MAYAGADHVKETARFSPGSPAVKMSPLGEQVADLLGELFFGIYHIETKKVDWSDPDYIAVNLRQSFATYDFDHLTRLVILCHDRCIRCEISGIGPGYIRLVFHPRAGRTGRMSERHPTIEDAVAACRQVHPQKEKRKDDEHHGQQPQGPEVLQDGTSGTDQGEPRSAQ